MGSLSNLVELLNVTSLTPLASLAGGAFACGSAAVFVWRGQAPDPYALPDLAPGLPPCLGSSELAQSQVGAGPDAGLLSLAVPGGGE